MYLPILRPRCSASSFNQTQFDKVVEEVKAMPPGYRSCATHQSLRPLLSVCWICSLEISREPDCWPAGNHGI